jgi:hypothetical protein
MQPRCGRPTKYNGVRGQFPTSGSTGRFRLGALKLQQAGLIRYARGHITVIDRPGLEERSCECYQVVKKEYGRLLAPARVRAHRSTP